jgi:hypothetical protein
MTLDTQKFRLAKAVSDLEIETERLEQELDALKMRLLELEMQGLDGGETERGKRELEDVTMSVFFSPSLSPSPSPFFLRPFFLSPDALSPSSFSLFTCCFPSLSAHRPFSRTTFQGMD